MDQHSLAAAASIMMSVTGMANYIYSTIKGKTKPHLFSWLVWAIVMGVATALAYLNGAIESAFVIGNGFLMCSLVAALSLRYGEKNITRSDWIMFLTALMIVPLWIATKEPLLAAILSASVFAFGYGPTLRKAWEKPKEESLKSFGIWTLQSLLSVLAVNPYLLVTGLYPTTILAMDVALVLTLVARRRLVAKKASA